MDEGLKKLVDQKALSEDVNPDSYQKEYGLKDDEKVTEEPKLMPILKDIGKSNDSK